MTTMKALLVALFGVIASDSAAQGASDSLNNMDCRQECEEETAFCLLLQDEAGVGAGLRELYKVLRQKRDIPAKELQAMFGVNEDPCSRSDTFVDDDLLINEGKACRAGTEFSLGNAGDIAAGVVVPDQLALKIKHVGESLTMTREGSGVYVYFSAESLQADWGGLILTVIFEPARAIIKTESACIRYSFGSGE